MTEQPLGGGGAAGTQGGEGNSRTMAMLAHLLGFPTCCFLNLVGPLIIWLTNKDKDAFIADQAKEALNFQILITIAYVVVGVSTRVLQFVDPLFGFLGLINLLVFIANLVLIIVAGIQANNGVAYRYPFNLRLIK